MKKVIYFEYAQDAIEQGVNQIADAVGSTLGPKGRHVIIGKLGGSPIVTKDGVTVAKEFEVSDEFVNLGARMLKEVAVKAAEVAGDGTTTSTVLGRAIYQSGRKAVSAGANPVTLKNGIHAAVDKVMADLKAKVKQIDSKNEVTQVASIASNNDTYIGEIIADAMEKVGTDGVVTVEEGKTNETYIDLIAGMQFDKGWVSQAFATEKDKQTCVFHNARLFLTDDKNVNIRDLTGVLQACANEGESVVLIAPDFSEIFLTTILTNKLQGRMSACCVKVPGVGDTQRNLIEDIAVATGGKALLKDSGKKARDFKIEDMGRCGKIVITKHSTTITNGYGEDEKIDEAIEQIKSHIAASKSEYETEKLQERLARLAGGIAQINVGAATEVEMKEKKARIEDALHATRAAIETGVLPGGGIALLRSREVLTDFAKEHKGDFARGIQIVYEALAAPIMKIAENAGANGEVVVQNVLRENKYEYGYDAASGEYGDVVESGIIDPAKVTTTALETAASIAGLLLTSQVMLVEENPKAGGEMLSGIPGIPF